MSYDFFGKIADCFLSNIIYGILNKITNGFLSSAPISPRWIKLLTRHRESDRGAIERSSDQAIDQAKERATERPSSRGPFDKLTNAVGNI